MGYLCTVGERVDLIPATVRILIGGGEEINRNVKKAKMTLSQTVDRILEQDSARSLTACYRTPVLRRYHFKGLHEFVPQASFGQTRARYVKFNDKPFMHILRLSFDADGEGRTTLNPSHNRNKLNIIDGVRKYVDPMTGPHSYGLHNRDLLVSGYVAECKTFLKALRRETDPNLASTCDRVQQVKSLIKQLPHQNDEHHLDVET